MLDGLRAFTATVDAEPAVYMLNQGWSSAPFDSSALQAVAEAGVLPVVAWEPWDYRAEPTDEQTRGYQPDYRLHRILDGDFDAYIDEWARGIASYRGSVGIRFAHEMNGYWYPWAESANGNRPGEYVQVWRYVRQRFDAAGAGNAIWIWSPNVSYRGSTPLAGLYPGDDMVDWVGLVGFYGLGDRPGDPMPTFDQLYGPTIAEVRAFTGLPLIISEVGGTNRDGLQAAFVEEVFRGLSQHDDIIGVIWFEVDEEGVTDWRMAPNPAAVQAFEAGINTPRFVVGPLETDGIGR